VVSTTLWTLPVRRRPGTHFTGVGDDKVDAVVDFWDYRGIASDESDALGCDTTLLGGWFVVF
jgi:hypothetical protein